MNACRVHDVERRLNESELIYEVDGDQVVAIDNHAYRWRGSEPLAVGDRVLLPENWVSTMKHGPGPYQATVTGLGTKY